MPKRGSETSSLEFIAKKLRKLEKVVKRSRRDNRNVFQLSSSSSSLTSSQSSRSCSSREPTPTPLENQNNQDTTDPCQHIDTIEVDSPLIENSVPDTTPISIPTEDPVAAVSNADVAIETEISDILGADPSLIVEYGPDINKDVATRFTHITTSGLNKDVRRELVKKYLVPANCTNIAAPHLNAEIKAALPEQVLKRDKAIESRQKQMAAGISSLGVMISNQLNAKDKNSELIKDLMDVSRIFCDIQHSESEARRNFALYSVKRDVKEQLSTTKIDKYLFGTNFMETIKAAKAVSKSCSDLKPDPPKKPKPSAASTSKNLNWKARIPARRQPPGPPPRLPPPAAPSAPPRGHSSQAYTQRSKPTRRH